MHINVAIDGPAGAGKSTIAKKCAKELGFIYVDTGALYRAIGVNALRQNVDTRDSENVEKTLDGVRIQLRFIDGEQRVFLGDEDVSEAIRTPEASMAASNVSAIPSVRSFLFDLQRNIAKENDCIMDGRDIGTVVLPDARFKIFMTATAEIRAQRRYDELIAKGIEANYRDVLDDIIKRDYQDSHREIAPLKQADDAVVIDTTQMTPDEVAETIIEMIRGEDNE